MATSHGSDFQFFVPACRDFYPFHLRLECKHLRPECQHVDAVTKSCHFGSHLSVQGYNSGALPQAAVQRYFLERHHGFYRDAMIVNTMLPLILNLISSCAFAVLYWQHLTVVISKFLFLLAVVFTLFNSGWKVNTSGRNVNMSECQHVDAR